MEKPFLLFAGESSYPSGGWNDFKGQYETLEEALKEACGLSYDWMQIVDVRTSDIVFSAERE